MTPLDDLATLLHRCPHMPGERCDCPDRDAAAKRVEVELARLREKLEWVKHALPPSASDELTEWLDGNQEASE